MASTGYIIKTAIRDSRKDIGKLMMFIASIILGIAALVAINSFNDNLVADIDNQAATLLGADIEVSDNKPIPAAILSALDSIGGEHSEQWQTVSMAYIPKTEESQFVNIKAIEGDFPYYGEILTEPAEAGKAFKEEKGALVDDGMMLQYQLRVGDTIKLGTSYFPIIGRLMSPFGGSGMSGAFAPAVYIHKPYLQATGLVQPGSLIDYNHYYKVPAGLDAEQWSKDHRKLFRDNGVGIDTIEERKEDLNEAFSSLNSFLNLIALVSLLLGCIGVASSVLIYIKTKISSIAVFRCLGMKSTEAFSIYLFQILILGLVGVIAGVLLGSLIQMYLPIIFRDLLPYEVEMELSPSAMIEGLIAGMAMTTLFALGPLLTIRDVSPLQTLRISDDVKTKRWSPAQIIVQVSIVVTILLFLRRLTGYWQEAAMLTIGLLIAYGVLLGVSKLIAILLRKFYPKSLPYVFRQGLSNLYRPNNQTQTLILTLGIGTAVLTTLFIVQGLLLKNVASMDAGNQPNTILFGIETDQKQELRALTQQMDLPILQDVPIITMNIDGWKGRSKKEWLADSTRKARRWVINREARVTFRDTLEADETLIAGTYTGYIKPGDSIFISVEKGWAQDLDVAIGDEIVWNVQGMLMKTYIGSLREIKFNSMSTRFFVLFPKGVLERAPQFHVLVTKTPDNTTTAKYRSAVVKAFPNVSVIDLGSILTALSGILSKVSYVIKFMAGFSILTGLIVLLASLLLSKYQRIKESVLLRTIGASRSQIFKVNATEYAVLGSLSAATGIILALAASYFLVKTQLELDFTIDWWPILGVFLFVTLTTVIIGLINSREVIRKSPLEVLRSS